MPEFCELLSVDTVTVEAIVVEAKGGMSAFIRDPVQQTLPSIPLHYWGSRRAAQCWSIVGGGSNALGSPGGQAAAGS